MSDMGCFLKDNINISYNGLIEVYPSFCLTLTEIRVNFYRATKANIFQIHPLHCQTLPYVFFRKHPIPDGMFSEIIAYNALIQVNPFFCLTLAEIKVNF